MDSSYILLLPTGTLVLMWIKVVSSKPGKYDPELVDFLKLLGISLWVAFCIITGLIFVGRTIGGGKL